MTGLVLAGTYEARQICLRLAESKVDAIASFAGVTRHPEKLGLPTRHDGFGGADGFYEFLKQQGIKWVLDGTHPFAANMTNTVFQQCKAADVPMLIVQRPAWQAQAEDNWHMVDVPSDLLEVIEKGSRVFLGTGRQTLDQFVGFEGRELLCRVIDPPTAAFPFESGEFVIGRPPFSVEEEIDFFRERQIDWVVVKNSGGMGGFSKLMAARKLGLPVGMIKRPALPSNAFVTDIDSAITWIAEQIKHG